MEKDHFEQSKIWLKAAILITEKENANKNTYSVGIAMLVHSVIKANDALTFKFLKTTAKRHDDARRLFEDLIKGNFLSSEKAKYKNIIQEAINNKAKSEYRINYFSKNDFEDMKRKTEKFVEMVSEYVIWGYYVWILKKEVKGSYW